MHGGGLRSYEKNSKNTPIEFNEKNLDEIITYLESQLGCL